MPRRPAARAVALVALVALACAACAAGGDSVELSDQAVAPTATPSPVETGDYELEIVPLAIEDIETFWSRELPDLYGLELEPVSAVVGYDAANDPLESIPSCGFAFEDRLYAQNAFYCPVDDTILFDEGVLFPEIQDSFGAFAVATVLAHEYSHVIHARLGMFDDGAPSQLLMELQADCFAGAWVGDLQERGGGELGRSDAQIDEALSGMIFVSDPVGTALTEPGAHGNGFDRVNAFSDGLFGGAEACIGYLDDPPELTARAFQASELLTQGNLPVSEVVPLVVAGLELFWTSEFEAVFGFPYEAPEFIATQPNTFPVPPCGGLEADPTQMENLATYCTAERSVIADIENLLPSLAAIGDFAVTYPIVHAWSQQVLLDGLGVMPTDGVILSGDCVSGSWTRAIFDGQESLGLSAGDIDEALISFGAYTPTGPNGTDPGGPEATIERVAAFGSGFFEGTEVCLD